MTSAAVCTTTCIPASSAPCTPDTLSSNTRQFSEEGQQEVRRIYPHCGLTWAGRLGEAAGGHQEDVRVRLAARHGRVVAAVHRVAEQREEVAVAGHLHAAVGAPRGGRHGRGDAVPRQVAHQPPRPGLEAGGGQQRAQLRVDLAGELRGADGEAGGRHHRGGRVPRLLPRHPGRQLPRVEVRRPVPG